LGANVFIFSLSTEFTTTIDEFFHLAAVVPRELTTSLAGIPVNQPVPEWTDVALILHGGFCT